MDPSEQLSGARPRPSPADPSPALSAGQTRGTRWLPSRALTGLGAVTVALAVGGCGSGSPHAATSSPTSGSSSTKPGPSLPLAGTFIAAPGSGGATSSGVAGVVNIVVSPGTAQLCWVIVATGVRHPTGAQVVSRSGAASAFTIGTPNGSGKASGCATAPTDLVQAIVRQPADFRVTIDETGYPSGAATADLTVDRTL